MLIKYIGEKALKHDNVADTGLAWTQGQVHEVEDAKAARLLRHAYVWAKETPPLPDPSVKTRPLTTE